MRKETFFIICLMLSSYFLKAQNLPNSLNSKLTKHSISKTISALPTKPQIPYLEELKQIQSLKKSYDSLRKELKELKEITADSTQHDSLFTLAKERNKAVLEQESKTLESQIENRDISHC
jgi:protein subunit release factor A